MKNNLLMINANSYSPWDIPVPAFRKEFTIVVHAVTDGIPGAFDNPEDLANWILSNPYVRAVELKTNDE